MNYARSNRDADIDSVPRMPSWVTVARSENSENLAFLSGAALSHLDLVQKHCDVPNALLRERLALTAAEACVAFSGRPERAADLRDEVHLLKPADQPGPGGAIFLQWRKAVASKISVRGLQKGLPHLVEEDIAIWIDQPTAGQGGPVAQASAVLETVLGAAPREEAAAMILADAALARSLGWQRVMPLLATGLHSRDLHKTDAELRIACHRAITNTAIQAARLASDLTRRTERLRAVAPKLRTKRAGQAVEMFLTEDAIAPSRLSNLMSDRAARRFCDRLVELGVVRELTGRDTFRFYGV